MAEVTMQLPEKQTLTYTEPGVQVSAKEAPPTMTYVSPSTQVTMKPTLAYMTYLDKNPVELEAPTKRRTTRDITIAGSVSRTVVTDEPVRMEILGAVKRRTTLDLVLTAPAVRRVTSYKVDLEYGLRRNVTNSADLEAGLRRDVRSRIEIAGNTVRVVLSDEDGDIGVPSKEYGSFVDANKLYRVQHDVLDEDVSDNPYFEKQISNLRNAALLTRNQTIIKAINELFVTQREAFVSTFSALKKVNVTIGDVVEDRELREAYAKIGVENVIAGIVKLSANIDTIIGFIGSQSEDMEGYKELGYENLVNALNGLNEKIKSIDYNWEDIGEDDLAWMFRATDYIPEIQDQVFSALDQMQEEINAFRNGLARNFTEFKSETELTLANQYQTLIAKMHSPYESITEAEIREMFKSLGEGEIEEDSDIYFQMFKSLSDRLQSAKDQFEEDLAELQRQLDLANQDIQGWASITEKEIRRLFENLNPDEEEEPDPEDVYMSLIKSLSDKLDAQADSFEQTITQLREDLRNAQRWEDWAEVTEKEIKWLFDQLDPDAEPDEDSYAALIQQLADRIATYKDQLDQHIADGEASAEDYANITEAEIRKIFQILSGEETEESFENRIAQLINNLTERVIATENENIRLNQKLETLEGQVDGFNRGLDLLSRQIASKFDSFTTKVEQKIRYILSALENAQSEGDGTVTYETLVAYIETELQDVKTQLDKLDNRVTGLEIQVESALTEDDIASPEDIIAMFPGMTGTEHSGFSSFVEASEEQIRGLFQNVEIPGGEGGTTTVKDLLDLIVSEEDIMDIFRPYIGDQEINTLEELLQALANRNSQ